MGRYVKSRADLRCHSTLTGFSNGMVILQLGGRLPDRWVCRNVQLLHVQTASRERGHDASSRDPEQKGHREAS